MWGAKLLFQLLIFIIHSRRPPLPPTHTHIRNEISQIYLIIAIVWVRWEYNYDDGNIESILCNKVLPIFIRIHRPETGTDREDDDD